jgi:hypothetical protein
LQEESMDPWSMFLYGMKAPMTKEKYKGRLAKFFDFIGPINSSTMEERAKVFTERGRKEPDWAFATVLRFAQAQKERVENGEISPATLRNYIKAVIHPMAYDDNDHGGCMSTHIMMARQLWELQNERTSSSRK